MGNELVVLPEDSLISDAVVAMKDRGISSVLVRSVYSFRGNPTEHAEKAYL